MGTEIILGAIFYSMVLVTPFEAQSASSSAVVQIASAQLASPAQVIAQKELNLKDRLPNEFGASVFADNILLALHYLKGDVQELKIDQNKPLNPTNMDWEKIREPFQVSFTLEPGQVFAFHGNFLPEFEDKVTQTANSRFFIQEGYKSLAGLGGNGVCHLASLIDWTASEANLEVVAKVDHDFYPVPGVPREFGVSIQSQDKSQNLYIENNLEESVVFEFIADSEKVNLLVKKS